MIGAKEYYRKNIDKTSGPRINNEFRSIGVSYPFIYYKLLDEIGEDRIIEQIKRVKKLSDDVFLVDCNSNDNIECICSDCGIDYYNVKPDLGEFHMSKCMNKGIFEAKYNFVVPVNFDCLYPINLTFYIKRFFSHNDPRKHVLYIRLIDVYDDLTIKNIKSAVTVYYKPIIIEGRGWDERVGFGLRTYLDAYIELYMQYVRNLKPKWSKNYYIHHLHHKERLSNNGLEIQFRMFSNLNKLRRNLKKNKQLVVNSYF